MRAPAEQPARPSDAARECPQASCLTRWRLPCLPRLRRSTVLGQLLVSFCSDQHLCGDQAEPGEHTESLDHLDHLCSAFCRSRSCFSSARASSVFGPAPTPFSAPFAFNVWAMARRRSLTSRPHSQRVECHRHLGLTLGCRRFLCCVGLLSSTVCFPFVDISRGNERSLL